MGIAESLEHPETHLSIKFIVLYGCTLYFPKIITILTTKFTDHSNTYNHGEKVLNTV